MGKPATFKVAILYVVMRKGELKFWYKGVVFSSIPCEAFGAEDQSGQVPISVFRREPRKSGERLQPRRMLSDSWLIAEYGTHRATQALFHQKRGDPDTTTFEGYCLKACDFQQGDVLVIVDYRDELTPADVRILSHR